MAFFGYVRPDSSVGTRNYVLVLPQGFISSKIRQWVPGTRAIVTPQSGAGRTADDRETIARLLIGLGRNPNVASVILHTATTGSGYPELRTDRLADEIAAGGKRVEVVDQARDGGTYGAIVKGVQLARRMVYEASRLRREEVPDECLSIGVKCGYSDTTSGIAGNPAVGYLMDSVVASGGTALFGETTEVIGAEQVLARRAVNSEVAGAILRAVNRVEAKAKATGYDIRTVNPAPANIRGGISSLEEKSLGAIHKAGSAPIQGMLKYGERPAGKGLYFVDNWMGHPSIFAGYAAAGANLVLFLTGGSGVPGKTVLEPCPTGVVPQLWVTANPRTHATAGDDIDFYGGAIIEGTETPEEAGKRLCSTVREIASGTLARSETIDYDDAIEIYLQGPHF